MDELKKSMAELGQLQSLLMMDEIGIPRDMQAYKMQLGLSQEAFVWLRNRLLELENGQNKVAQQNFGG